MKKTFLIFLLILIVVVVVIVGIPCIYIIKYDLFFDEIVFINLWFELFGGGIIIASLFFVMTKMYTNYERKKEDKQTVNKIIYVLESVYSIIKDKKSGEASELLLKCRVSIPTLISSINNSEQKEFVDRKISDILQEIIYNLEYLQLDNDTRIIESKIINTINEIRNEHK